MDLEFRKSYTSIIVKFSYFMFYPILLLAWGALAVLGFRHSTAYGLAAAFVVGPVVFVAGLLVVRVLFEMALNISTIAADLRRITNDRCAAQP